MDTHVITLSLGALMLICIFALGGFLVFVLLVIDYFKKNDDEDGTISSTEGQRHL